MAAKEAKTYHLKWASHIPNMETVFTTLLESEGLADVTIMCESASFRVHRLILSTCSNYFLKLFLDVSSKRPILSIPGIADSTMRNLLTFIYTGEVQVADEMLDQLLQAAEMLEIRGLSNGKADDLETSRESILDITSPKKSKSQNILSPQHGETKENHPTSPEKHRSPPKHAPKKSPLVSVNEQPDLSPHLPSSCPPKKERQQQQQLQQHQPRRSPSPSPLPTDFSLGSSNLQDAVVAAAVAAAAAAAAASTTTTQVGGGPHQEVEDPLKLEQEASSSSSSLLRPVEDDDEMSNLASSSSPSSMIQPDLQFPTPPPADLGAFAAAAAFNQSSLSANAGTKADLAIQQEDVSKIMGQLTLPTCPLCAKDCGNFPNLRSHLQTHVNAKPFACEYCDVKFSRASHLCRHRRTHTGEKPFECKKCGKLFSRQDKLKTHMDRHIAKEGGTVVITPRMSKKKKAAMQQQLQQQQQHQQQQPLHQQFPMPDSSHNEPVQSPFPTTLAALAPAAAAAVAAAAPSPPRSWSNVAFPGFANPYYHGPPPTSAPSLAGPPPPSSLPSAPLNPDPTSHVGGAIMASLLKFGECSLQPVPK